MSYKKNENVILENAKVRYQTNFEGRQTDYNPQGRRVFNVEMPEDVALRLMDDGWNIKKYDNPAYDDDPVYYTELVVNYAGYKPPKIWRVTSKSQVLLDENNVRLLDGDTIDYVDVVINPYHYPPSTTSPYKVKGYVVSMHVRIKDDPFMEKYADIPERDSAEPRWFAEDED